MRRQRDGLAFPLHDAGADFGDFHGFPLKFGRQGLKRTNERQHDQERDDRQRTGHDRQRRIAAAVIQELAGKSSKINAVHGAAGKPASAATGPTARFGKRSAGKIIINVVQAMGPTIYNLLR